MTDNKRSREEKEKQKEERAKKLEAPRRAGRFENGGGNDGENGGDDIGFFGDTDGLGGPEGPPLNVALSRAAVPVRSDAALWSAIRNRTRAIAGDHYEEFIKRVLCNDFINDRAVCIEEPEDGYAPTIAQAIRAKRNELLTAQGGYGVDAYQLLKYATQAFLLLEAGIVIRVPRNAQTGAQPDVFEPDERIGDTADGVKQRLTEYLGTINGPLPYLNRIVNALAVDIDADENSPFCTGTVTSRFTCPSMLELIWSYWHEEGMLVQTMNAICMRFQNRRGPSDRDPLANLELDPLRPLNNLLWGYIQDEYNRLTVPRRAYEYDHHYGLKLVGKAVPEIRSADSRSKFIEAFHNLLYRTAAFYREDADTTVIADGFALLSALREVHLLLAEGAHNQFGDLPWTSRAEMLMMQFMLGRPEIREFLRGRAMVPYNEPWMGQVDTMKKLQGWTDTTITHFRNLAVYGEQILLSVRYGDWNDTALDQDHAKIWARYWRPEIQGYIHAYLAATGVDLSEDIVDFRGAPARYVQPSALLQSRVASQGSRTELTPAPPARGLTAAGLSFGALSATRRRALNPARKD
jgi:hypothetical protein